MRSALIISLSINALLLVLWGFDRRSDIGWSSDNDASANAISLIAQLKQCGIAEEPAKQLITQQLLNAGAPPTPYEYWTPQALRDSNRQVAEAAAAEQARRDILKIAGEGAAEDPAYRTLFRPLDTEYPFLTSAKQIDLARLQAETSRRRAEAVMRGASPSELVQVRDDFLASLGKLLTPEELFEYQLRASPAAQALLAGGFKFEEEEFRRVFSSLIATAGPNALTSGVIPLSGTAATDAIRQGLGEGRFGEYEKSRGQHGLRAAAPARLNAVMGVGHKE